jgi:hypothetical protein
VLSFFLHVVFVIPSGNAARNLYRKIKGRSLDRP